MTSAERCRSWHRGRRNRTGTIEPDAIGLYRFCNVLDLVLAHRLDPNGKVVAQMIDDGSRHADAARLGKLFEASRDVHTLAVAVRALDNDIAKIDSDADLDAFICRQPAIALCHVPLNRHRAFGRID